MKMFNYYINPKASKLLSFKIFQIKLLFCSRDPTTKFESMNLNFHEICKVHIFWEGHKNFMKSPSNIWLAVFRTNNWWRFRKILWPSQNIWILSNARTWYSTKLSRVCFLITQLVLINPVLNTPQMWIRCGW